MAAAAAAIAPPATASTARPAPSQYVADEAPLVATLAADEAFKGLTAREAAYARAVADACWAGFPICWLQSSPEAPALFVLMQLVFHRGVDALRSAASAAGVSAEEFSRFLAYSATVIDNAGPYRSFGDTKIVPPCAPATITAIAAAADAANGASGDKLPSASTLWSRICEAVYATEASVLTLGLAPEGVTSYYSRGFTAGDAEAVNKCAESLGLTQLYNSRAFKVGDRHYEIRLASAAGRDAGGADAMALGRHTFDGATVDIVQGDHAPWMRRIVAALEAALPHAANETQAAMLREYIRSFTTGDLYAHIEGSRHWVKDVSPAVESYIGFIESYRDPCGVRGEWEGFVAVVNRATSAKFGALVSVDAGVR